ncbi:MAG: hypothetical protein ACYTE2_05290 [Planctomycetota bacterium]
MSVQFRVISIGALGTHPLWEERTPQRADHATTVLVASGSGSSSIPRCRRSCSRPG